MVKIVVEISSARHLRKEMRQFDTHEIRIGRGYHNDIIIQDAYVSSEHAILRLTEEGWFLEDLNSRNGVFLLKSKKMRTRTKLEEPRLIESGQIFFIGSTVLRIFLADHPVAPAKRQEARAVLLKTIDNPINALYAIFGFFIIYYIDIFLTHPNVDVAHGQIIFVQLLVFIGVMIWSGIWALVGRMIRRRAKFLLHLTMTCLFLVAMLPLINTAQFLGYLFSSSFVEGGLLMLGGGGLFTLLLVSHEAIATFLSLRARIIFSAMIPIFVCVLSGIGYIAVSAYFQPSPRHYVRLRPPVVKPFFIKTQEDFVYGILPLFEHDE